MEDASRLLLLIGDGMTFAFLRRLLPKKFSSWYPEARLRVVSLKSEHFDFRKVGYYLDADLIVCQWRYALIELAFQRHGLKRSPPLILYTGAEFCAHKCWDGDDALGRTRGCQLLMKHGVCDLAESAFNDTGFARLRAALDPQLVINKKDMLSKEGIVLYVSYLDGWHGRHHFPATWSDLPLDEAYPKAMEALARWRKSSMDSLGTMVIRPSFQVANSKPTLGAKSCFMIMPFSPDMKQVYDDIIRPTAMKAGIEIHRADDFFSVGSIMEDIWRRLNSCDFVIADLTGRNPNVFYELGIVDTIGKPVILLTQNIDDIPFDIRHKRIIQYSLHFGEIDAFRKTLRDALAAVQDSIASDPGWGEVEIPGPQAATDADGYPGGSTSAVAA